MQEYKLKQDITGKVKEKIPMTLTDKNGLTLTLPHQPEKNCRKCYGRGFTATDLKTGRFIICNKCYKLNK